MKKSPSSQPIIGISTSLMTIDSGCFSGRERTYVGHDYVESIILAGGLPIILPNLINKNDIERHAQMIDGLLLSGGNDISPFHYQEVVAPHLENTNPQRDHYELALVRALIKLKKPIFGICRGLQLINVALGGSLYQDIFHEYPKESLTHKQTESPDSPVHNVQIVEGTQLAQIFETTTLAVNSYHHQSIKSLAPSLTINALAEDGVVEGVESIDSVFIIGVQWHPEVMLEKQSSMLKLFSRFVAAAAEGAV